MPVPTTSQLGVRSTTSGSNPARRRAWAAARPARPAPTIRIRSLSMSRNTAMDSRGPTVPVRSSTMTEARIDPALDPPEATQAAVAAAAAADVVVRELHRMEQLKAAQRLFEEVWRPAEGQPSPVTGELLRALAHAGSYVVGAYAGTRMVGASAGFFTAPPDRALHSHITVVAPRAQH